MGKDNDFKKSISIDGYQPLKIQCSFDSKYAPDSVFGDDATEFILESSSTSDRKVHIAEMIQFLIYVSTEKQRKDSYYFILFLCGKNVDSPKADLEYKRLTSYFNNFPLTEAVRASIAGIFVAEQAKFSMNLTEEDFSKMHAIYKRR